MVHHSPEDAPGLSHRMMVIITELQNGTELPRDHLLHTGLSRFPPLDREATTTSAGDIRQEAEVRLEQGIIVPANASGLETCPLLDLTPPHGILLETVQPLPDSLQTTTIEMHLVYPKFPQFASLRLPLPVAEIKPSLTSSTLRRRRHLMDAESDH